MKNLFTGWLAIALSASYCLAQSAETITASLKGGTVAVTFNLTSAKPKQPQPLEFINPTGGAIRRGRTMLIEWQGGSINNEKELELYRWEKKVASLGKVKGVWLHTWTVPKDFETGDGYSLKLVGNGESVLSNTFRVKPRTPLFLKLSPLFVAAAIIPFLGGSEPNERIALPAAPNPE